MAHFELVLKGEDVSHFWPLKTKAELKHLEKEEKYCTWLQRRGGGVDDQIPCLRLQNRYFLMSLRVQKVVFRHVRLGPSFRNLEYTITGRPKLWIPLTLLREKLRTASRSLVRVVGV